MTAPIKTSDDVCNYALAKAGIGLRINSIYDGTPHARKILDVYSQTRDAILRLGDWGFAQKTMTGSAAVGATIPYPWNNAWVYPTDCLKVRSVYCASDVTDSNNPLPTLWCIEDDVSLGKVVLTRAPVATIIYTAQVTDPTQWDSMFLDAFAASLGQNLRSLLPEKEDPNTLKLMEEEFQMTAKAANEVIG